MRYNKNLADRVAIEQTLSRVVDEIIADQAVAAMREESRAIAEELREREEIAVTPQMTIKQEPESDDDIAIERRKEDFQWVKNLMEVAKDDDEKRKPKNRTMEELIRELSNVTPLEAIYTIDFKETSNGEVFLPAQKKNTGIKGPLDTLQYVWPDYLASRTDDVAKAERVLQRRHGHLKREVFSDGGSQKVVNAHTRSFYEKGEMDDSVKLLVAQGVLGEYNVSAHEHRIVEAWCYACRLKFEFCLLTGIKRHKVIKKERILFRTVPPKRRSKRKMKEVADDAAQKHQEMLRSMGTRMSMKKARIASGVDKPPKPPVRKRKTKKSLSKKGSARKTPVQKGSNQGIVLGSARKTPVQKRSSQAAVLEEVSSHTDSIQRRAVEKTVERFGSTIDTFHADGPSIGSYFSEEGDKSTRSTKKDVITRWDKDIFLNELTEDLTELSAAQTQFAKILEMMKSADKDNSMKPILELAEVELATIMSKIQRLQRRVLNERTFN